MMIFLSFITLFSQSQNLTAALDKIYSSKYPSDGPGCAVLVASKGEVIYRKAFGMANLELKVAMVPENVFRIASLTKQFTAVAILQLQERGLLNIEDDIKKYIPDFPSTEKITLANLISHTSGIKNITDELWNKAKRKSSTPTELVDMIKHFTPDFKPGTSFSYSNSGYILLGYIIEKVSGKTYEQYTSDNIFKPLKMDQAYYDHMQTVVSGRASGYVSISDNKFENADFLDQSLPYSAGALMMTVDDMYKWNKGLYTQSIIKKETLEKAFTYFTLKDGNQITNGLGWGLASFMGSVARQHAGGTAGFSTFAIYLPSEDLFAVGFSNLSNKDVTVPTLLATATAIGKLPLNPPAIPEKVKDLYPGRYQFPDGRDVNIYTEKANFYMKDANSPVPWQMHFTDEKNFYCEEVFPNNHVFTFDSFGKVDGFVIQFGRGEMKIKRVN